MTREYLEDVLKWAFRLRETGEEHHLNPALLDYYIDYVVDGQAPEDAAVNAMESCEITNPIAEI